LRSAAAKMIPRRVPEPIRNVLAVAIDELGGQFA
jgi:hypothetical protein